MQIYINGKSIEVNVKSLSYETICEACGYSPDHCPSVTFSRGRNRETGMLYKGISVSVSEGMHISCMVTNNA